METRSKKKAEVYTQTVLNPTGPGQKSIILKNIFLSLYMKNITLLKNAQLFDNSELDACLQYNILYLPCNIPSNSWLWNSQAFNIYSLPSLANFHLHLMISIKSSVSSHIKHFANEMVLIHISVIGFSNWTFTVMSGN